MLAMAVSEKNKLRCNAFSNVILLCGLLGYVLTYLD